MKRLAAGALLLAAAAPVHAQPAPEVLAEAPSAQRVVLDPQGSPDINPTGQRVVLTVPLMEGQQYLGDVTLTLEPGGEASFAASRLLTLLEPRLRGEL